MNNWLFFFFLKCCLQVIAQWSNSSQKNRKKSSLFQEVLHTLVAFKPIQPNQMECVLALFQATGKLEINLLT